MPPNTDRPVLVRTTGQSTRTPVPPYTPNLPPSRSLLPPLGTSFLLHAGSSLALYAVGRATDRAEAKDWLWPSGMVVNAWWQAVGQRVVLDGVGVGDAWDELTWREKLLLAGVTAWGTRLFYRILSRSLARGTDDPRYTSLKSQPGFWNSALFKLYLPEALFQTLITLPFTAPFRLVVAPHALASNPWTGWDTAAVALWGSGMALEVLADAQLSAHAPAHPGKLQTQGVWSLVRHPNYLGDALVHLSFPLLTLSTPLWNAWYLLGPAANYVYLRFVGGDSGEGESVGQYAREDTRKWIDWKNWAKEVNSFWPGLNTVANKWSYIVLACGAGTVVLERALRNWASPLLV
ncbi:DUF1295-domain-containing protein [Calocera cornea HHB12733]|uniref:DUF1295-domain-containing protein n=1 Tax=Calocera cornea HHB12733 TaxID=1353952 RepID=A0A165HB88_9BASI|nr:DUF1295-domain-containing protein [Calocera cornea HHB12733]